MNIEQIRSTLKNLRPGVPVDLGDGIQVVVTHVRVKDLTTFMDAMGRMVPEVQMGLARSAVTSKDGKADIGKALAGALPKAGNDFIKLINECVEPRGCFLELPAEMSAKVIEVWLDVNVLDEGKVQRWKDAGKAIMDRVEAYLPATPSGTQSPNSSSPASA